MADLADRLSSTPRRPPVTPRGAGLRAAAFLALAAVAAAGAGLLFSRYLDRRAASGGVETAKVVVAAADLPIATTLREEQLSVIDWPRAYVPAGAPSSTAGLIGKVTVAPIAKGEAVLPSRLATGDTAQGLAAILPPEMRAVAVRVDDVVGVAGFVHPGDHVDVLVTMKAREDSEAPPTSKIILQNVRVLSVGKELDRKSKQMDKAVPVTVATLMVDAPDSERLALAATKGHLLLALRGGADVAEVETEGVIPPDLLGPERAVARPEPKPEPTAATPAAAPAARPVPARAVVGPRKPAVEPPSPAPSQEVEILRGDRFERRQFKTQEGKP